MPHEVMNNFLFVYNNLTLHNGLFTKNNNFSSYNFVILIPILELKKF